MHVSSVLLATLVALGSTPESAVLVQNEPMHPVGSRVVAAAAGAAQARTSRLELRTWGPPPSARFSVVLRGDGELRVMRESEPYRQDRPTTRTVNLKLSPTQVDALFVLAVDADDFAAGCDTAADGTSARLTVSTPDGGVDRGCDNGSRWPTGKRTRAFINALNALLPKDMLVY